MTTNHIIERPLLADKYPVECQLMLCSIATSTSGGEVTGKFLTVLHSDIVDFADEDWVRTLPTLGSVRWWQDSESC